jgi:hypothetical protein
MKLTEKQKKIAWIAGAFLIILHFAPGYIRTLLQARQRPAPRVMAAPAVQPVAAVPLVDPQFTALAGHWTGRSLMPNYACDIKLELKQVTDQFTAYTTTTCVPTTVFSGPKGGAPPNFIESLIKASTPMSAIFIGKVVGPSIQLQLRQAIGKQEVGCQPTAYTLTPFGDNQLATKWDDTPCEQGQMVMTRAQQ